MLSKLAGAVLVLSLCAAPAGATTIYVVQADYVSAGLPLTALQGYAPPRHDIDYATGLTIDDVIFTAPGGKLMGIGADLSGPGQPEFLRATGTLSIRFPDAVDAFGFNLLAPGKWDISWTNSGGFIEGGFIELTDPSQGALFFGLADTTFSAIEITSPLGAPVNLLTTPAQIPEPAAWKLLAIGLLGIGVMHHRRPHRTAPVRGSRSQANRSLVQRYRDRARI